MRTPQPRLPQKPKLGILPPAKASAFQPELLPRPDVAGSCSEDVFLGTGVVDFDGDVLVVCQRENGARRPAVTDEPELLPRPDVAGSCSEDVFLGSGVVDFDGDVLVV